MNSEIATLAGGCFWCLEAVYGELNGVTAVESGYMGGSLPNPSYRDVCTGTTGHIEVVRVTFDPSICSYRDLLEAFFAIHDPASRDRQGGDVGEQYRSAIFFHSEEQQATAEVLIRELDASGKYAGPIVTEVRPATEFYRAEEYHRGYFASNPNQPYCQAVVGPKVQKFRRRFQAKLKPGA